MIEVQHLTKRYGRVTAVDDVSFRVEKGEILGFLGPNGAGKTTTMRILTGYIPATEGKAMVAGYDVFEKPIDAKDSGVFFLNSRIRYEDVTDGSSHTIFLGEKQPDVWDFSWMSGTRSTLRNTGIPLGWFGTRRPG